MKVVCDDPTLELLWETVVNQIDEQMRSELGEPFDLLSELSSRMPGKAAVFREVVFGEMPAEGSVVNCTWIARGALPTVLLDDRISFSTARLSGLSEKAQRGVIAHGLGHAWEFARRRDHFEGTEEENAHWHPLCWGFSEEIRQMYIEINDALMRVICDDPKVQVIWESVVTQINGRMSLDLGEPFDLLSEMSFPMPGKAATFREVVFGEKPERACGVALTSIPRPHGSGTELPAGKISFSIVQLRELSEKAQRGVIAHELGHAWDMHNTADYLEETAEEEADKYALDWGFSEEIRQMYIELHGSTPPWLT